MPLNDKVNGLFDPRIRMESGFRKTFWIGAFFALLGFCFPPDGAAVGLIQPSRHVTNPSSAGLTVAPPESLDLEACVRLALTNNPLLAEAAAESEAARARQKEKAGAHLPSLYLTGGYNRFINAQRLVPVGPGGQLGIISDEIAAVEIAVTMPLYSGGRISRLRHAAGREASAASKNLARIRSEIVFSVTHAYYNVLGQRHVVASLEYALDVLRQHRTRIEQLMQQQKAARVDLLRTDVRLATLEQQHVQERNALTIQEHQLATILGMSLSNGTDRIAVRGELAETLHVVPSDSLFLTAYARRSDYDALQLRVEAQEHLVAAARGALLPQISLRASFGERYAPSATVAEGARNPAQVGSAALLVTVPLFEGFQTSAQIRREKAQLSADEARLKRLRLQIELEVQAAKDNVSATRERVLVMSLAVDQAKESLDIERRKYELGSGAIVDVLDAQAALLEAQTAYYRALGEHHTSWAELQLAMGEDR